jgi:hypothetical protein
MRLSKRYVFLEEVSCDNIESTGRRRSLHFSIQFLIDSSSCTWLSLFSIEFRFNDNIILEVIELGKCISIG